MSVYEKIETALSNLETSFQKFQERNKYLEKKFMETQRPTFEYKDMETDHKPFIDYLKTGDGGRYQKSLSSGTETGSLLMPSPVRDMMFQSLEELSPVRRLARVTTITTDTLEILTEKDKPQVGWASETSELAETQTPELNHIRIPVHYVYAKPKVSQKLLDDSAIQLDNWLVQKISHIMAVTEEEAFIRGDGDNKPKGFLTYPLAPVGSGSFGKIEAIYTGNKGQIVSPEVLFETMTSLKSQYLNGATWLMSRSALAAIRQMKDPSTGHFLWQPGLMDKAPGTLLGYPVVVCDHMPALTTGLASTPIAFGNFSQSYQIVDRQGVQILRDPYSAKPYVEFYVTKRVGGDVVNFDAIKLISCDEA
jgi:HK97 family phage major capsid protein